MIDPSSEALAIVVASKGDRTDRQPPTIISPVPLEREATATVTAPDSSITDPGQQVGVVVRLLNGGKTEVLTLPKNPRVACWVPRAAVEFLVGRGNAKSRHPRTQGQLTC